MTSRVKYYVLACSAILCCIAASPARAEDIEAHVTYVAWKTLYLNVGRAQGIENGLWGLLYRDESLIGEISIAATADSTCVATLEGDSVIAQLGDKAIILREVSEQPVGSAMIPSPGLQNTRINTNDAARHRKQRSRFTGRASVQTDIYQNKHETDISPGVSLRSTVSRVVTNNSQISLKYRGRQRNSSDGKAWQHRLYEAGLTLESSQQRWRASVGRIQAGSVAGIGYLDGAYGEASLGRGFAFGAFGGALANVDLSSSNYGETKVGALVSHRRNESSALRSQMSVALAGEYVNGNVSREFIYQQFTLGLGSSFSLYESSDFNINRDWRRDAEGTSMSLANVLANVRFSPVQSVSLSAGYDGRARYHDWDTRETPDSLFDNAIRHGLRAGVELAFLHGARLSAQQSYRSDPATGAFYPSGSYSLSSNSLFHGTLGGAAHFSTFSNQYSTGELKSVSATWTVLRQADLRAEYGQTMYDYRVIEYQSVSEWIRGSLNLALHSGTYFSLQAERNGSGDESSLRTFIELGQRFR